MNLEIEDGTHDRKIKRYGGIEDGMKREERGKKGRGKGEKRTEQKRGNKLSCGASGGESAFLSFRVTDVDVIQNASAYYYSYGENDTDIMITNRLLLMLVYTPSPN